MQFGDFTPKITASNSDISAGRKIPARPGETCRTPGLRLRVVSEQLAFDELETPLYDTTFVVVDLETTGTSPQGDAITEIGAVKVRGGEVLGEFATLVNPGLAIPPQIVQITGITTAMLIDAPRIESVLPGFLEFAHGAVLVAHNARFDTGFLRAAAAQCEIPWPAFQVVCTVQLARRVLNRDEAPSVKLSFLAELLGSQTRPTHRALDDARATVDVLHALMARVGNQGVHSLTELLDYLPEVTRRQRAKRTLAADLPATPASTSSGVLRMKSYIGTAVNLRRRVRNYFTGSTPVRACARWCSWRPGSIMSNARTRWRRACANCDCCSRTPRRTTAAPNSRSGRGG